MNRSARATAKIAVLGIVVLSLFGLERGLLAQSGASASGDSIPSPRLRALAGEIQRGNAGALSSFWRAFRETLLSSRISRATPTCGASPSFSARRMQTPRC